MKYELINTILRPEVVIDENSYSVGIELNIHPTDNVADDFWKVIEVVSNNSQTGFEVDEQRAKAIEDYINQINK